MDADLSMKILVIILSVTLAIFLILSIVLVTKLIQVANGIKRITVKAEEMVDKAEEIVDKAEAVTDVFRNAAGPVVIGRFISNLADMVSRKGKKG